MSDLVRSPVAFVCRDKQHQPVPVTPRAGGAAGTASREQGGTEAAQAAELRGQVRAGGSRSIHAAALVTHQLNPCSHAPLHSRHPLCPSPVKPFSVPFPPPCPLLFPPSSLRYGTMCPHSGLPLFPTAPGCRWLLWVGLLAFLAVAMFVGYKRAPAVVKAPLDMVAGAAAHSALVAGAALSSWSLGLGMAWGQ